MQKHYIISTGICWHTLLTFLALSIAGGFSQAEPVVPGTGFSIPKVGDNFEDEEWSFRYNLPKSSKNLDERTRGPGGRSKNGRWYEGVKRGQPDVVRRVATPENGIPGSKGALLLRSRQTGIPRLASYQLQQDDFICNVRSRLGGALPVHQTPNFVVRVFMPPVEEWENRRGPTFAIRAAVETTNTGSRGLFSTAGSERETYWPGMFINFKNKERSRLDYDTAYLSIRSDRYGRDFKGPAITQTGWWTFGMSFTPDGQVHYYASEGVDDLTEEDHLTSQYPYGFRCERFKTFFFNVCNGDNGKTWSTPWIIDDSAVYYIEP